MESVRNTKIMCDKLRLNQVLLNVLSNAIKYTQNGGSIVMQVIEKKSLRPDSALFEFRIRDNGMGMNAEFLKMIYEPFTRANSTTVSGIQGTGLGMSITKSIVEMMGGHIETFSEENKGTEVVLDIDFKLHDKVNGGVQAPVDEFDFTGRKILIVEDNKMNRDIARDILVDNGLEVVLAENGQEAVEMVKIPKKGNTTLFSWMCRCR
jgi:CheY-like chemotaxis protein